MIRLKVIHDRVTSARNKGLQHRQASGWPSPRPAAWEGPARRLKVLRMWGDEVSGKKVGAAVHGQPLARLLFERDAKSEVVA